MVFGSLLLLAACSPATPAPTITPTLTVYSTRTPTIAATLSPSPLPTQPPVHTPTISITPIPSPITGADFSQAKLIRHGFVAGYNYFLTFELTSSITRSVYGMVDQNKKYACTAEPNSSNRIRCVGWLPGVDKWKTITIFDAETNSALFEQRFYIPMQ